MIDFSPQEPQADEYRELARKVDGNDMFVIPKPLSIDKLESILMEHGILD